MARFLPGAPRPRYVTRHAPCMWPSPRRATRIMLRGMDLARTARRALCHMAQCLPGAAGNKHANIGQSTIYLYRWHGQGCALRAVRGHTRNLMRLEVMSTRNVLRGHSPVLSTRSRVLLYPPLPHVWKDISGDAVGTNYASAATRTARRVQHVDCKGHDLPQPLPQANQQLRHAALPQHVKGVAAGSCGRHRHILYTQLFTTLCAIVLAILCRFDILGVSNRRPP